MGHIYTKSGDKGKTGLLGGVRVSKSDLRIAAIGELDELNAMIGVVRSMIKNQRSKIKMTKKNVKLEKTNEILRSAQDDLFYIGAELAMPPQRTTRLATNRNPFSQEKTHFLEQEIDRMEAVLPPLKNFILPGGTLLAAQLHLARAVCRRAERALVRLAEKENLNPEILKYINRLSDLLFMVAREENGRHGQNEEKWASSAG